MSTISDALHRVGVQKLSALGNNHPTAFFALGVAGVITSTVMACRSTLKLEQTLDEYVPESEADETRAKVHVALSVAKLYAPAFIVGAASITMLTKSHSVLVKRNAALSAAYTALDNGFREYRGRVVEKYGQEEDDRLRYGHETETTKKGNKTTKVDRFDPKTGASIYARFFDEYNPNWGRDPEISKVFLLHMQNYANDTLLARGHLFLNEVYDMLGFDHSQAGAVVGWILNEKGDNYVDFGVFNDDDNERIRDFVNGREGVILLDFNVDGVIFDKIKEKKPDIRWQRSRWLRI